jgi:hypothetical protein
MSSKRCAIIHKNTKVQPTRTITPWSRVLPEKVEVTQLVKKFPAFYGIQRFITMLIRAHPRSLS